MRMKNTIVSLFLIAAALLAAACNKSGGQSFGKKKAAPEEQQSSGESKYPVLGSYDTFTVSNCPEISGICLNKAGDGLIAVGDQGQISSVTLDGKCTKIWYHDADMEDVTLDPRTGNLYIAIEGSQKIYQVDGPDYNTYKTLWYVQEAVDRKFGNSGLEGISYYRDDIIFVGSQWGAFLWQYRLDGTMISKISLEDFADEVAGLCYDPVADWLWVADSDSRKIYICTVDGKLLHSYSVSQIGNAESICVDRAHNAIWIGDDADTPKLYRYECRF